MKLQRMCAAAVLAMGVMGLVACNNPGNTGPAKTEVKADSLYMRLGGAGGVRKLVDGWMANVMADEKVNGRFKNADMAGLKAKLTAMIGEQTGGPEVYLGKDVKTAHKGMNLSDAEWDAFIGDLKKAMASNGVKELEQQELLVKLEPMKRDIVGK